MAPKINDDILQPRTKTKTVGESTLMNARGQGLVVLRVNAGPCERFPRKSCPRLSMSRVWYQVKYGHTKQLFSDIQIVSVLTYIQRSEVDRSDRSDVNKVRGRRHFTQTLLVARFVVILTHIYFSFAHSWKFMGLMGVPRAACWTFCNDISYANVITQVRRGLTRLRRWARVSFTGYCIYVIPILAPMLARQCAPHFYIQTMPIPSML